MLLRRCVRTLSNRGLILSLSTDSSDSGNKVPPGDKVPPTKSTQIPFKKVKRAPTIDKASVSESDALPDPNSDDLQMGSGDTPSFKEYSLPQAKTEDKEPDVSLSRSSESSEPQYYTKFGESLERPFEKSKVYIEQRDDALSEVRKEMLSNLTSLLSIVNKHGEILQHPMRDHVPIRDDDFFNVKSLFTLRDLFDNRVHLGHHMGCWNVANKKYLYGTRNKMHVIDIASTEQHLWRALNVLSHVVYNGGHVLFTDNRPGYSHIVQEAAGCCAEQYDTDTRWVGKYETVQFPWFHKKKLALVICSSVNNPRSQQLLLHCNKYLVPTIGILDSDVDHTNLTYVVPGNDDTTDSVTFYYKVFAKAIQRAKTVRLALQTKQGRELTAR